jgi:hypothetical protein
MVRRRVDSLFIVLCILALIIIVLGFLKPSSIIGIFLGFLLLWGPFCFREAVFAFRAKRAAWRRRALFAELAFFRAVFDRCREQLRSVQRSYREPSVRADSLSDVRGAINRMTVDGADSVALKKVRVDFSEAERSAERVRILIANHSWCVSEAEREAFCEEICSSPRRIDVP